MCQWILVVENSGLCGSEVVWVHATCSERPVRCSRATTIPRPLKGEDTVILKAKGECRLNKSTREVSAKDQMFNKPSGAFREGSSGPGRNGKTTGSKRRAF